MAKRILIDEEYKIECLADFKKMLENLKFSDGKVSFTKTFTYSNRKANLFVTLKAWIKMKALVSGFDSEVAWHGVARRLGDESEDNYIIEDVIVYPQIVAGTTVDADDEKDESGQTRYEAWKWSLTDDQFNNLRFQGHSHVNMSVTPSGTDITDQKNTVERMGDGMFYIFMIMNKSGSTNLTIYDKKKNICFENSDINMNYYEPDVDVDAFIKEAKKMTRAKTYTPPSKNTGDKKKKPRVSVASLESSKKNACGGNSKYGGSLYGDDDEDDEDYYGYNSSHGYNYGYNSWR